MKAEERHRLHTNALAQKVGTLVETVKEAPASRTILFAGLAVVAIVVLCGWYFYSGYQASQQSALWSSLDSATRDYEQGRLKLEQIVEDHGGSLPGRSARFILARNAYEDGLRNLNSLDHDRAVKQIKFARDTYIELATECADAPILAGEAMMGIATAEETLIGVPVPDKAGETYGSADDAAKYYKEVAAKFPDSYLGKEAKKRSELFAGSMDSVKKLYADWEQLVNPRPTVTVTPPAPSSITPPAAGSTTPTATPPVVNTTPDATKSEATKSTPPVVNTNTPPKTDVPKSMPPVVNTTTPPKTDATTPPKTETKKP